MTEAEKDELHREFWDNWTKEALEEHIIALAGAYQGERLIDLCEIWNYNRALVAVELECGTDVEEIAETLFLDLGYPHDWETFFLGVQFYDDSEMPDVPF